MAHILLGVSGGIAAYKAVLLLRMLQGTGHQVRVIPTPASLDFVGDRTWQALTGEPVYTETQVPDVRYDHIEMARWADLLVIAPLTANTLGKLANGLADNLLTATCLAFSGTKLMAPAMHPAMLNNPAVQRNATLLTEAGCFFVDPGSGELAHGDSGTGRLAEPEEIFHQVQLLLGETATDTGGNSLAGKRILISAGGTREALDPVRFLGNRSTGIMGRELARAALCEGAQVTVVAANVTVELPKQAEIVTVESTAELAEEMLNRSRCSDIVIMAAAVADLRPIAFSQAKIQTGFDRGLTLQLEATEDILAELLQRRHEGQVIVGFAAETGNASQGFLEMGRAKAIRKGADLLAVNKVGASAGFGNRDTHLYFMGPDGELLGEASGTKFQVAQQLLALVSQVSEIEP
ncbi:MAG: bifunctional phosphopantothenoylcysteine decarboxylase/phosphopantothenate--cysteine ligase CoaBC [Varibaculum sp.]|nr:bifunctional phosphopantothenoylcysteine decarboxylase/phosphopantothenate--cysteine ligase CoaBC [Varibaculum sp.]